MPDSLSPASAMSGNEALEAEIASLNHLSLEALRTLWLQHHGQPAPRSFRRKLLIRGIAYQMQVKAYGGLSAATLRRLQAVSGNRHAGDLTRRADAIRLKPGTRLMRDWNGATHRVDVTEAGFVWNGERHRSLSAIARAITGARWSGPRFFGVRRGGAS